MPLGNVPVSSRITMILNCYFQLIQNVTSIQNNYNPYPDDCNDDVIDHLVDLCWSNWCCRYHNNKKRFTRNDRSNQHQLGTVNNCCTGYQLGRMGKTAEDRLRRTVGILLAVRSLFLRLCSYLGLQQVKKWEKKSDPTSRQIQGAKRTNYLIAYFHRVRVLML